MILQPFSVPVLGPICSRPPGKPSIQMQGCLIHSLPGKLDVPRSHLALECLVLKVHILEEVHLSMKRFRHLKNSPKWLLFHHTEQILESKQPVFPG